ncbi:MAG: 50S ribosomal protein L4, partial [Chloroflexi bacterium]|nr:50S ribosomal protein L4 [Chloroflexota bacterium]
TLAERAAEGRVLVLESLALGGEHPRTRDLVSWLAKVGSMKSAVIVLAEADEAIGRAAANVPTLRVRTVGSLQLLDAIQSDAILVLRSALGALAHRAGAEKEAAA